MGLDIYLHRYENLELTKKLEAEYEKGSEKNWHYDGRGYDSLTDIEKDTARQRDRDLKLSLGLVDNDSIEMPSAKYPEHYFKIGYFRSSYNGGGINNVMRNLGLPDLYEIMGRDDNDDYIWAPDWEMCLVRTKEAIEQIRAKPNLRCFDVSHNELTNPLENKIRTQEDAMNAFAEQSSKFQDNDDGYSNNKGYFYPKGLKIFGLLPGFRKQLFGNGLIPLTYVIMEGENEWYTNALEIVQETIEYVLAQPDKDKYFLHWSS